MASVPPIAPIKDPLFVENPQWKFTSLRWLEWFQKLYDYLSAGGGGSSSSPTSNFLGKVHGNPASYTEGDEWYDLDSHKWKGFDGTNIVTKQVV